MSISNKTSACGATNDQVDTCVLCTLDDLIPGSGVCVLHNDEQIAIFYLPEEQPSVYGVSNRDPIGLANVISRGIVGDIAGELVVASPLYKQHFSLVSGQCLEDADVKLKTYPIVLEDNTVKITQD